MGHLRVTRFDEAYFDDAHFDGDYGTDNTFVGINTFDNAVREDVDQILSEWGQWLTIINSTFTKDGMGNVTAISDTDHKVNGIIMDISRKDLEIFNMGLAVPGNVKGYFKQKYYFESYEWIPKEGDILTDRDNTTWRIEKILGERRVSALNNYVAFTVLVLKNLDLEGSG